MWLIFTVAAIISKYKQRRMYIYIKTKCNETGLSPLSVPFWLTLKQLKWITIPVKPLTITVRPKNVPHWPQQITVIIKTKEI